MIALDTNVLLRFALNDDPSLSPLARDLVLGHECHVSLLALAEVGFVLASVYGASDEELVAQVRALLTLATLHFEYEHRLPAALAGVLAGVDWFDALLWAASPQHAISTFDRDFARRAAKLGWTPAVESRLPATRRPQR